MLAYSIVGWSLASDASIAICTAPAAPCTPDAPVVTGVTNTSVTLRCQPAYVRLGASQGIVERLEVTP